MAVATSTKKWTLEELHSLPDDGNKYELVHGELFVTPAPREQHQLIINKLAALLVPYVAAHALGYVWQARSVVRLGNDEVEPDLFVRAAHPVAGGDWSTAPRPILVAEVLSESTRRRDLNQKRHFYMEDARIPEYWIADPDSRTIRVARPGLTDVVADRTLTWLPSGVAEPLAFDVERIFEP